jgi:glycosyltransferase involved in cell wall biosynthesis
MLVESSCCRVEPMVTLVLPTYNYRAGIERTWASVRAFLVAPEQRLGRGGWEALFVCDGCTDGTDHWLIEATRHADFAVRTLAYAHNRGKGYAVRLGLACGRGRFRLFTDVDLAYALTDVQRLADELALGQADVVIGSREHPASRLTVPTRLQWHALRRSLQGRAFAAVVRCLLGLRYADTQAGLKGFTATALSRLLPLLRCDGFCVDCEMLWVSEWLGLRVAEVPVEVRYESTASTTNLRTVGAMLLELWRLRRGWASKSTVGMLSALSLSRHVLPTDGQPPTLARITRGTPSHHYCR